MLSTSFNNDLTSDDTISAPYDIILTRLVSKVSCRLCEELEYDKSPMVIKETSIINITAKVIFLPIFIFLINDIAVPPVTCEIIYSLNILMNLYRINNHLTE
jgi:hypothetical protein